MAAALPIEPRDVVRDRSVQERLAEARRLRRAARLRSAPTGALACSGYEGNVGDALPESR